MNAGQARAAILKFTPPAGSPLASVPRETPAPAPGEPAKTTLPAGRWARYAGKLGAALTVSISAASIRKGGHEPNDPDDSDVDLLQEALEEGLRLKFGDTDVPWWLGAALAAGGVYAGMRIGARKVDPGPELPKVITPDAQPERPPVIPTAPVMPPAVTTIFPPAMRKSF
jgi:hypothetical protein